MAEDTTRTGFLMSLARMAAASWVGLLAALGMQGATRVALSQLHGAPGAQLVGLDANGNGVPITLKPGITLQDGYLNIELSSTPIRSYNIVLTRDASGTYTVPSQAVRSTIILRNGIRQALTLDYTMVGAVVTPVGAWAADDFVACDGQ
jgi:hypothetical protein